MPFHIKLPYAPSRNASLHKHKARRKEQISSNMNDMNDVNETVELVAKKRKIRFEHVREILRKQNLACYGKSVCGHDDEYVGDRTFIFRNGYAARLFRMRKKGIGVTIGCWDENGNVWFKDGESNVKIAEDKKSARDILDGLAKGQLF